jgi:ribosomal protein S18 acetylase RimI-like enzyme
MINKGDYKMSEKILNETICLKEFISEKEYEEISELEKVCDLADKTRLKLELDYKLNMNRNSEVGLKNINEFFYYEGDILVAYLGISSYVSNVVELNGMTHPHFRRKGIFKKLFEIAVESFEKRKLNNILLLTDGKSNSGIEFIKAVGGSYNFSEYGMKVINEVTLQSEEFIVLRKAEKRDRREIARQNAIFFNDGKEEDEIFIEREEAVNEITYMVELKGKVIGKIRIQYDDNSAFVYGFGILPSFRGKGYGKKALKAALRLINEKNIENIELEVECKNDTALKLYKACGFEEQSVINYYKYNRV